MVDIMTLKRENSMTKQTTSKTAKKTLGNKTGKELIRRLSAKSVSGNIQEFTPGDTVNVHVKVKEGEKERVQVFKGVVVKIQGSGSARSFTVRKISSGIGVERTFPFRSSNLEKVEKVSVGKVRRAKLYYLRNLHGKAARIETELVAKASKNAEAKATENEEAKSEA